MALSFGFLAALAGFAPSSIVTPQNPGQVTQDPPPAPAGETTGPLPVPGAEAEPGGNPEPVPTTRFLLEDLLHAAGLGKPLENAGLRVYGWTQGSYTTSTTNESNAPTVFNDRADYSAMGQNWLEIVRSIDTTKNEVQIGGRAALILPGYDYKYTLARGLWNEQSDRYGFDSVYIYGEVFLPGMGPRGTTLRAGRWATTIGYEMIEAVATPFVTRSYNFAANPYTHTGVQATTELSANLTMYHGFVTGADVWFDPAKTLGYVGGLKWTADGGASSLAANVFFTGQGFDSDESFQHYDSYNVLFTQQIAEGWTYALDATYGRTPDTDPTGLAAGGSAQWVGLANYLVHPLCETVTLNLRGEFFRDDDGLRTGTAGNYVGVTAGLQWAPTPWLWLRPFARFDRNGNGPFEGDNEMRSGGLEVIARW